MIRRLADHFSEGAGLQERQDRQEYLANFNERYLGNSAGGGGVKENGLAKNVAAI
jgi:hypothetical protein